MPPKKLPKKNASGSKTSCDLCTKLIAEGKEQAIQCEGACQQWYHQYCAGISTKLFKHQSSNDSPFICMSCRQQFQDAQVSQLQSEVANLRSELLELRKLVHSITNLPAIATLLQGEPGEVNFNTERVSQPLTSNNTLYTDALRLTDHSASPITVSSNTVNPQASHLQASGNTKRSNSSHVDKRFNIVIYGLNECPKGSPRHIRITKDTELACKAIKSICPDMSDFAVCDCLRIGRYSEERTRPLVVKFTRSCDVATVFANRYKIPKSESPNISIKPFMSRAERNQESTLLKERRALIESGVDRKTIKIRGNSIFINKIKVGSANETNFTRHLEQDNADMPSNPALSNYDSTYVYNTATPINDSEDPKRKPQSHTRSHSNSSLSSHSK